MLIVQQLPGSHAFRGTTSSLFSSYTFCLKSVTLMTATRSLESPPSSVDEK